MTLNTYLQQNNIEKDITVLMLNKGGDGIDCHYLTTKNNDPFLKREVMEVIEEDDAFEIWVM